MLVRMVVVCFVALRYFLLVLIILIVGFSVAFMLLAGAIYGESGLHESSLHLNSPRQRLEDSLARTTDRTTSTALNATEDLEVLLVDLEVRRSLEFLAPDNGTFDIIELPVAVADTFGILLGSFNVAELWNQGPVTFTAWVSYMLFGNIVMLNCVACLQS